MDKSTENEAKTEDLSTYEMVDGEPVLNKDGSKRKKRGGATEGSGRPKAPEWAVKTHMSRFVKKALENVSQAVLKGSIKESVYILDKFVPNVSSSSVNVTTENKTIVVDPSIGYIPPNAITITPTAVGTPSVEDQKKRFYIHPDGKREVKLLTDKEITAEEKEERAEYIPETFGTAPNQPS